MLLMPLMQVGFYYALHCGFDVASAAADIGSYYCILAIGYLIAYFTEKSGKVTFLSGIMVILVGLYGAALILFTLVPPRLPIFIETFAIF